MQEYSGITARFLTALKEGQIPHAILIAGPEGSGRTHLAERAAALLCTGSENADALSSCPDFFRLGQEKYKVDDIRALREELTKRPFREGEWRVVLMEQAHRMEQAPQNALLKTLEEPPLRTVFLLTGVEMGLLPTIRSRCTILRLSGNREEDTAAALMREGCPEGQAKLLAKISGGLLGRAMRFYREEGLMSFRSDALSMMLTAAHGQIPPNLSFPRGEEGKERAMLLLDLFLSFLGDMQRMELSLPVRENPDLEDRLARGTQNFTSGRIQSMIKLVLQAKEHMNYNVKPEQAIDSLLIGFCKQNAEAG